MTTRERCGGKPGEPRGFHSMGCKWPNGDHSAWCVQCPGCTDCRPEAFCACVHCGEPKPVSLPMPSEKAVTP